MSRRLSTEMDKLYDKIEMLIQIAESRGVSAGRFCCGLAEDWLRTKGGLIHQALASLRRHDPQQREGSGVSGY